MLLLNTYVCMERGGGGVDIYKIISRLLLGIELQT